MILGFFCTAIGRTWSQMFEWTSRVNGGEDLDPLKFEVIFNFWVPRLDDPNITPEVLSTAIGTKSVVWSILRSYEMNGPVEFEALDLPPRADAGLVKTIVRFVLGAYLDPDVVPKAMSLDLLGKGFKPLFHVSL